MLTQSYCVPDICHFHLFTQIEVKNSNRLWCDDLHEGVRPHNPKMMYIGMQDQWFTFNMFDAQAGMHVT